MGLKRNNLRSVAGIARVEALESRQLLSATLVEITIPTTPAPVKHVTKPKVVKKAVKPKVVHAKVVKTTGEQHANIGYEVFAG